MFFGIFQIRCDFVALCGPAQLSLTSVTCSTIKHRLFHGSSRNSMNVHTYVPQQVASNFISLNMVCRWVSGATSPEHKLAKKWLGYPNTESGMHSVEGVVVLQRSVLELTETIAEVSSAYHGRDQTPVVPCSKLITSKLNMSGARTTARQML